MNNEFDPLAHVGEKPDMAAILEEYQVSWTAGDNVTRGAINKTGALGGIDRIAEAENIRYSRWAGQSSDGLRHSEFLPEGERAMPYDGAPDTRVPFADETINSLVDVLYSSFWGARINVKPVHTTKLTTQQCAEWRAVLTWIKDGPLKATLVKSVDYLAQMAHMIGHAWVFPSWKLEYGLKYEKLSLDQIVQLSQAVPDKESILANLVQLVQDPDMEDMAVELMQGIYEGISEKIARKAIRELRKDGNTMFPRPEIQCNRPELEILLSWTDLVLPPETTDIQDCRMPSVRRYLTQAKLESMASPFMPADVRWNRDFVDAAKKTGGMVSDKGVNIEQVERDSQNKLIEVVHSFVKGLDENGVSAIYCTIWSPHVTLREKPNKELYASHYIVDYAHNIYPLVDYTTEVIGKRADDARGVPEIIGTSQTEVKRMYDGLGIFTELSLTPPLNAPMGVNKLPPEFGPFAMVRRTQGTGELTPINLVEHARPDVALALIEDKRKSRDEYFGLDRPDTHPSRAAQRKQRLVNRWLLTWEQVLWQLSILTYQNMKPEELQEIIGHPPSLTTDILRNHRLSLWFDVRSLDQEWVKELITNAQAVVQLNSAGTFDMGKLAQLIMSYLDPTLADEVTLDVQGASQAMFEKVKADIAQIALGNEASYVENDPTAKAKLGFMQQIIQANPDYMAVFSPGPQGNERKRMLLEKYAANLQQSIMQDQNKIIGRIGVTPENPTSLMGAGGQM
jgi:hypothetical protein